MSNATQPEVVDLGLEARPGSEICLISKAALARIPQDKECKLMLVMNKTLSYMTSLVHKA